MTQTEINQVRVEFDLNNPGKNGTVRVLCEDATGDLIPGQKIHAFQPEDGLVVDAEVVRVDMVKKHAFIAIDRKSLRDDYLTT